MNANDFSRLLTLLSACGKAREWANGKTLAEAWRSCERGDWLLWLATRMIGEPGWPIHKDVVSAAVACAETALKYLPANEDRPRHCLVVTRLWTRDRATLEDVVKARRSAWDAYIDSVKSDTDAAFFAAAAVAAASGGANRPYAEGCDRAAADAVRAAVSAAFAAHGICAAARERAQRETADIVRATLKPEGV